MKTIGEKLTEAMSWMNHVHEQQIDKEGLPYVLHPLKLMLAFEGDEDAMLVALLHDTLEDCDSTDADTLLCYYTETFGNNVADAIVALTRTDRLPYDDYVKRVATTPLARRVKIADLRHNLDTLRLSELTNNDCKRIRRYHKALRALESAECL